MSARSTSWPLALGLVLLLATPAVAQEPAGGDEASYEFLSRQGQLLFDYGKFDEATRAFAQACATPEGSAEFECWRRLGTTAEKAGEVGVAIEAWAAADDLGGEGGIVATQELQRLMGAYGEVRLHVPVERSLPTIPGQLDYEGLLIDPALKVYLAAVQQRAAEGGIGGDSIWLPTGQYRFEGAAFAVTAGTATDLALPARLVPYRSRAFAPPDAPPSVGLGGPWEVGADLELVFGGAPGGGLGNGPAGLGGRLRFGRHVGPLRLELGIRVGGTPVSSAGTDPDGLRASTALQTLGQLDVGVSLALGPRLFLVPHAALVGGSLGSLLTACRVEQPTTGRVWDGECRLGSLVLGGQAGADLQLVLPERTGRLVLRLGLFGEALAGGLVAVPGDRLKGGLDVNLKQADRWRFTWLRGGLDVGLSVRF